MSLFVVLSCLLVVHHAVAAPLDTRLLGAGTIQVTDGVSGLVDVYYNDTIELYGWAPLRVTRAAGCPLAPTDPKLWYAAGYGEGVATYTRIYHNYVNTVSPVNNSTYPPRAVHWIEQNLAFMDQQIALYAGVDLFWAQTQRIREQLRGMLDGYNHVAPNKLSALDFYYANFQFEIGDLITALNVSWSLLPVVPFSSHCSGLIRLTADDLYMSHVTWTGYDTMLRMYKDYNFGPSRVVFSGYPGMLHSGDDWYMLGNNLTVQETTNGVDDTSLFRFVEVQSVPEWIRVMVANYLGTDGFSWSSTFCRYNNGLYNNQYMVVNMNLYTSGMSKQDLPDGVLWVTEQLPGMCPYQDVTAVLRSQGYWASYNIPYFPQVNLVSGNEALYQKWGDLFSYTRYARPMIFARDAPKVQTLADMKRIMRYNKWQTDPLSQCPNCNPKGHPILTISSRYDLVPTNGSWGNWTQSLNITAAYGGTDAKIASYSMLQTFDSAVISGPTYDDQPVFRWSTAPSVVRADSHVGHPDTFKFPWVSANQLFQYAPQSSSVGK